MAAYYAERDRNRVHTDSDRLGEESVTISLDRYRRGLTTFLDVQSAQRALYAAQSNLAESNGQQLSNLIALHKALDGGWQVSTQKIQ